MQAEHTVVAVLPVNIVYLCRSIHISMLSDEFIYFGECLEATVFDSQLLLLVKLP